MKHRTFLALLVALPVLAGTKVEIDAQVLKDADYAYELNSLRGWNAIPHRPGEKSDWQRAWGGEDAQRFEILVWTDRPEDAPKPYSVKEEKPAEEEDKPEGEDGKDKKGKGEFHELYQGLLHPFPNDKALLERLEGLRKDYNAALDLKEEEQAGAFLKCRMGYKDLLKSEADGLNQAAEKAGFKKVFESDKAQVEALDPKSAAFKDSLLAARAALRKVNSVPRYLLGEMKMSKLTQAPFAGASKGTRYDFVSGGVAGIAVEIPSSGRKFALVYTCPDDEFKRSAPAFEASAKSFKASSKWTGVKTVEAVKVNPDDPKAVAKSEAMKGVAGVPGWWCLESPRYIIVTNVKKESTFPKAVADQLESIRDLYEKLIPPAKPVTAISIVRICKTEQEYMNYGAPSGSAGYWSSFHKELVLYGPENAGRTGEEKTMLVMRHEAFHQYIFYCMGDVDPHSWLNEGTGDFFAGAKPVKSGAKTAFLPQEFDWRINTVLDALNSGKYVPLAKILRYSQPEYYADSDLCYSEGWSIVYYLLKATAPDSPYRKIIPAYLATLETSKDAKQACDAALDGIDVAALEKDWAAFWKNATLRVKVSKSDQIAPIMLPRK